jgi:glycosyltransferase involved in cell wall biosynthesis
MEPMRVAVTLEQCWHRVPGGTAVAALETVRALQATGAVDQRGVSAWHRAPAAAPWAPPVPVHALPLPRRALYAGWLWAGAPACEAAVGRVDLVHATTIIVPPRRRAPLVVTLHDLAWRRAPEHFSRRGVRTFERGLHLAVRHADAVLCSSGATLDDAAAAGFDRDRLHLVPLGVRVEPVTPEDVASTTRRHGLDRPYAVFVGTVEPRKNLAGLLAAFDRLADVDLDLAVVGPAGWGPELGPTGPRVRRLGFVAGAEKAALVAGAAVCVQPSLWEGFGLPVLEAMGHGTPVVTSAGTATEEAAGGAAVLVDPRRPDAIADGIREALAASERLASAGRARAQAMSWNATAAATLAVYRSLR